MSTAEVSLAGCDGFRVESPEGLVGWVEEVWLGPSGEPVALATRLVDGRRGLLPAEEIEAVVSNGELVLVASDERMLELAAPRVEARANDGGPPVPAAVWRTTGARLEPPAPPGLVAGAILALRPWRLAPPRRAEDGRPLWQMVAILYAAIVLIVASVIVLDFLIAHAVTGAAY